MLIFTTVLVLLKYALADNILFISPVTSPSHYLWNKILSLELVKNGHNVTVLSHEVENKVFRNFTVITIDGIYELKDETLYSKGFVKQTNIFKYIHDYFSFLELACQHDINSAGFKTLFNYPKDFKFDLIIYDITFATCLYGFIPRFNNPPVVAVSAMSLSTQLHYAFGNPLFTSHMPFMYTGFTNDMTFKQRLFNFIYYCIDFLTHRILSMSRQQEIAKKGFGEHIPTLMDIERNISLFLLNTDPIFDYPIPLLPNIIPVGGLHVGPPKPLPKDLESLIGKYNGGIIYFSLGTNLKSGNLKKHDTEIILKTFSRVEQLVFWKHDNGSVENLPKNVIVRKWFPQNDLLGHPKIKLFITHCGALGSQEAMYHGVPMVAIPFHLDQKSNAAKLSKKEISVYIDYNNFTYDSFHGAVEEVLNNRKYRKNVKLISERYKSQPQTALERAVFWIEHVLRYGSVDYLNSPLRTSSFYKLLNIDVAIVLIFFIFLLAYVIKFVISVFIYFALNRKIKEKIS